MSHDPCIVQGMPGAVYGKALVQEVRKRYGRGMEEVCKRYARGMQEVWKRYGRGMEEACKKQQGIEVPSSSE